MPSVVLDSTNLDAIVADATGEPPKAPDAPEVKAAEDKPAEKPAKAEEVDENGLTDKEREVFGKRFDALVGKKHRQMKEAEEFAAENYNMRRLAEKEAEAKDREIARLKAIADQAKPADDGKPKREDFQSDEAYRDKLDDWRVDQKFKAREAEAAKERQERVTASAVSQIARAKELVPDYTEKTEAADYIVPPNIGRLMLESAKFAEFGYYFAEHPEELGRLAILNSEKSLLEFRKLESTLAPFSAKSQVEKVNSGKDDSPTPSQNGDKPSSTVKAVSDAGSVPSKPRAAAPIIPLNSGTASVEKDESEMSGREALQKWQRDRGINLNKRSRH